MTTTETTEALFQKVTEQVSKEIVYPIQEIIHEKIT